MANMIPDVIDTKSPGERKVFYDLMHDSLTNDWTVLHSLHIADHENQKQGETDFLIIVPENGIINVEIKANRVIRRIQGKWLYGQGQYEYYGQNPFKQSIENSNSIKDKLIKEDPKFKGVLFWHCVFFTETDFLIKSAEWNDWEWYDKSNFEQQEVRESIYNVIEKASEHLTKKGLKYIEKNKKYFNKEFVKETVKILRPDFNLIQTPADKRKKHRKLLEKLTKEKFQILDGLAANKKIIVDGGAGTGKTYLALELARRNSLKEKKTLFLCYNRLFYDRILKPSTRDFKNTDCYTMDAFMMKVLGDKRGIGGEYFSDLSYRTLFYLQKNPWPEENKYDELIIDEAQDLFFEQYRDILGAVIKGGLYNGCMRFFADVEEQVVRRVKTFREIYGKYNFTKFPLTENLRNTEKIINPLLESLGVRLYKSYKRVGDQKAEIFYTDDEDKVISKIEELKNTFFQTSKEFESEDCIILSASKRGINKQGKLHGYLEKQKNEKNGIEFTTVRKFKGCEARVVIIVDVDSFYDEDAKSLLYTGFTRATEKLIIFSKESIN